MAAPPASALFGPMTGPSLDCSRSSPRAECGAAPLSTRSLPLLHPLPQAAGLRPPQRGDRPGVEAGLAIADDEPACHHRRGDQARAHPERQVAGDVAALERRRRVVVPERQVGLVARLDATEALAGEVALEQAIAVGDGANDLPMLSIAGLGIAFRAKPLVRERARQAISTLGLDGILYLLGVRDREAITDLRL